MFPGSLVLKKVRGKTNSWVVYSPLLWLDDKSSYLIPQGFKTDLTTMWIEGRHTEAAVLHDYILCTTNRDFKVANAVMDRAMESLGVRTWHRKLILVGITIGRIKRKLIG